MVFDESTAHGVDPLGPDSYLHQGHTFITWSLLESDIVSAIQAMGMPLYPVFRARN